MINYSLTEITENIGTIDITFHIKGFTEIPVEYYFIELSYGRNKLRSIESYIDFENSKVHFKFKQEEIEVVAGWSNRIRIQLFVEILEDFVEVPFGANDNFNGLSNLMDKYMKWEYSDQKLLLTEIKETSLEAMYCDDSEIATFYYQSVSEEHQIKEITFYNNESKINRIQEVKSKSLGNNFYSFTINLKMLFLNQGKYTISFIKNNDEKYSPVEYSVSRKKIIIDIANQGLMKFIFNNKKELTCRVVNLKTKVLNLQLQDMIREKSNLKLLVGYESRYDKAKNLKLKIVESITMVHLGTKIKKKLPVIFNWVDEKSFELNINLENLEEVEDLGVWDIFINYYSLRDNYFSQRIKFNELNYSFFAMMPYEFKNQNNNHALIRFYITKDNFLRSLVKKYPFKGQIDTIYYKETGIAVNGQVDYFEKNIKSIVPFFKNNEGLLERYDATEIDFSENENGITYSLFLKSEELLRILVEGTYEIYLAVSNNLNELDYLPVISNKDDIVNKSAIIRYPTRLYNFEDEVMSYRVLYNRDNALIFEKSNKFTQYTRLINNGESYTIEVKTFKGIEKEKCVLLVLEDDHIIKSYYPKSIEENTINYCIKVEDFRTIDYFKANLVISYNDIREYLNSNNNLEEKKYKTKIESKAYLNFHLESRKIIFEKREPTVFEKPLIKYKNRVAKLAALLFKSFYRKKVWIFGENLGEVAQDNGLAFFEYVLANKPEKAYYISKKNNTNSINLKPYTNHVIEYDSFKHMYYYHLSEYLVFSHGIRDVMPSILHKSMKLNKKEIIYLQHGIIAMKRIFFNQNSYNGQIKRFVVSSDQEKDILIKHMNFRENQVMVTGLARFDKLKNSSNEQVKKKILIMPTWREWLINDRDKFIHSEFYKNYIGLLINKDLSDFAERNNVELLFYPHFEIQKNYMDLFDIENSKVKVIKSDEKPLNKLLEECSLLITDYSSVAFDFNYLNKPVLFFQFDKKDYLRKRGSFVDMDDNLIGKSTDNIDQLVTFIKEKIDNNFQMSLDEIKKSANYYKYKDRLNSERIYNEIKKLGERK